MKENIKIIISLNINYNYNYICIICKINTIYFILIDYIIYFNLILSIYIYSKSLRELFFL